MHIEHEELGTSVCTLQRKPECISPVDGSLIVQGLMCIQDKEMSETYFRDLGLKSCVCTVTIYCL